MHARFLALAILASPGLLAAQQPTAADSAHRADSLAQHRALLPDIVVTAAPTQRTDPQSTIKVNPVVIRRTVAVDPYDLLRQTAGLEVHDQGQGPGFASDATVRGFSSDHSTDIALWIDGVPNNEQVNGHAEGYNDWYLILPNTVRGIEVIKGPTSAVYGNFALAGAVNVRTLERTGATQAWLGGGSYGRVDFNLTTGLDKPGTGAVFAIRGTHEDGWRPNSQYGIAQVYGRVVRDVSTSTSIDAGVMLHGTNWHSPGFVTTAQYDAGDFDTVSNVTDGGFKRYARERVSIRVLYGPNLLWRSTLWGTQGRWQLYLTTPPEGGGEEGTGSQTEEEDSRYGFGATTALTWTAERGTVTGGLEGRFDHSDYQNWFTTDRSRDTAQQLVNGQQVTGGAFAQASYQVATPLRVTAGLRYDLLNALAMPADTASSSATHGVVSPKLGALYQLTDWLGIYGNVSRGFRSADGILEDPSVPPITAWAYEAGTKFDFKGGGASLAVFRMNVSNEQTFDPITLTTTNGGTSRRSGIEADANYALTGAIRLDVAATINDAKYESLVTPDGDTLSGVTVYNTSKYVGAAAIEIAPPAAKWHGRFATNFQGPYSPFDEPGVTLSPYVLFHASAGYLLGRASLELGVRNLFDQKYVEVQAGNFVAPGQPITVYGSVQYIF
jgi:outer membrane receptor protein involved in Fe transport